MPARRASPRPKTRQSQPEVRAAQAISEDPSPGGHPSPRRTRPHTTRPRCTKVVTSRDFEAVPGLAGHNKYEYTTNIKFLPPSYFQYRYRSTTRQASAAAPVRNMAEHSPPSSPRRSAKSIKQPRAKVVGTEPKLPPNQNQIESEGKQKCTRVQFSEELVPALIPANITPIQDILHESSPHKSLNMAAPQDHLSSNLPVELKHRAERGLLQSSNMIFDPCSQNILEHKQEPLQSSLLTKGAFENLQSLNLTAVENPSLSTLAKRKAHTHIAWDEESAKDDKKDPSPFASIVQFPPPVVQPTVLTARRARSVEVLTASQDADDSLLDFMFVDL
ncbi:hypothetical protein QR46_1007 [Giardia duodenalis assemblage B]|uniref:Uncharacterized protein n=1 Tax=Giardia duodenalis assemblage B TaxID=1394984 RepID=A0A132NY08_GIAIN|nr:hypothetical protein QR46_1007 [Giardia intestinalis assemblage B]